MSSAHCPGAKSTSAPTLWPPDCRLCRWTPTILGIMARNHRGFVEALIAANRLGADVLLLNTSFAGPALAEVVHARARWVDSPSSTTRSSRPSSTARWPTNPTRCGSSRGPTGRRVA